MSLQAPYSWSESEKEQFSNLWNDIDDHTKLVPPKFNEPMRIQTDASDRGVGGIILQDHGIIAIFSKKLDKTQERYTVMEKEMFSIFLIFKKYRHILYNCDNTIETDNKNLIHESLNESNRIKNWREKLTEFNIKWRHLKGSKNILADDLSREKTPISTLKTNVNIKLEHDRFGDPGALRLFKTLQNTNKNLTFRMDQYQKRKAFFFLEKGVDVVDQKSDMMSFDKVKHT